MRTKWFNILQTTICNRYANAIFSIHLLLPLHCSPIVGRVGEWLDIKKARNETLRVCFPLPHPFIHFILNTLVVVLGWILLYQIQNFLFVFCRVFFLLSSDAVVFRVIHLHMREYDKIIVRKMISSPIDQL